MSQNRPIQLTIPHQPRPSQISPAYYLRTSALSLRTVHSQRHSQVLEEGQEEYIPAFRR